MKKSDIQLLLRQGIAATKADQHKQARQILKQVVEADRTNVQAWLWLSAVMDTPKDKFICLQSVLKLEPDHKQAQAGLAWLKQQALSAEPQPGGHTDDNRAPPDKPQARSETWAEPDGADKETSSKAEPDFKPSFKPSFKQRSLEGCPFCAQTISLTALDCPHCHLPLVLACPACEAKVDVEQPTCTQCGQVMGDFRQGGTYFLELAALYQKQKNYEQGLLACQAAQTLQLDTPQLYLYLGQAQAALGELEAAIPNFQQVLAQSPGQLRATLGLGKIFHRLHRWAEAQEIYRQALTTAPNNSHLQFAQGWLLMAQGNIKEALPYIQKTTQLNPQHGQAWLQLGQLQQQLNKPRLATKAYQQAVTLLPAESLAYKKTRQLLATLNPSLPDFMVTGWSELLRQMVGPSLICLLAALLDAGLSPGWIPWTGWAALCLAILGPFLWISGATAPYNPLICLLVGKQGLSSPTIRHLSTWTGAFCWLFALSIILLPLN